MWHKKKKLNKFKKKKKKNELFGKQIVGTKATAVEIYRQPKICVSSRLQKLQLMKSTKEEI